MNKNIVTKNITRFALVAAAALGTLLFVSITPSYGQKDVETKRSETI